MIHGAVDADKILAYRFNREDLVFYLKNFGPMAIINFVIMPVLFLVMAISRGYSVMKIVLLEAGCLMVTVLIYACCMVYMYSVSSGIRKKYKAMIERYGEAALRQELNANDNMVFMLHPDKYETYIIITQNFFIVSREFIMRLDEIASISVDMSSARGDTTRAFDPKRSSPRELTRFVKDIHIVTKRGTKIKQRVALDNDELQLFAREVQRVFRRELPRMTRFYYSYIGSIGGGTYHYELTGNTLRIEEMEHSDYGELEGTVSDAFAKGINDLISEHNLMSWNGFDGVDSEVLDGDGFSLTIELEDGSKITAHGSNSYPPGYRDFKKDIDSFMRPERDRIFETKRQELIAQGVTGDPTDVMIDFIQKGRSGSDKYEIFITKPGVGDNNVDVRVKSVSGEIWPVGEHKYYTQRETSEFLHDIGKIVSELNIITWRDFDKAAEDYNNEEWFQLAIGYGDGSIRAMGTVHPADYDEFRSRVLTTTRAFCEGG